MRRYNLRLRDREFTIDVQELSAERFAVVVDGQTYDVVLSGDEDLPDADISPALQPAGAPASHAQPAARVAPARSVATPTPTAAASPVAPRPRAGGAATLSAPMPGVILELFVKPGDVVQRGQQVAVLDAMKMHNLIGAPAAGTIVEVCVAAGQAVGHGDPIVRFAQT
jgi:glutaconyl-CoA/methylmalonyl-CoA decarboxylase subunit gamma